MRIRVAGEGHPSPTGGPPGDCYCFLTVREHPLFHRQGQHLICRVPVTYSQAALGATVEVPTLDGKESLTIPPGTQPGAVLTLRGRGLPDPQGGRRPGDLHVQIDLDVPKSLTARQKQLLRELADIDNAHVSTARKTFFEKLKDYFVPGNES
jgi:molecular chaperone DnaJ